MVYPNDRDGIDVPPKSRRWIWILLALLLISPVVAYFGFTGVKHWRANQMSRDAVEILDNETPTEDELKLAWERSRSAYQLLPNDLDVVRAVARVHDRLSPDKAPEFWREAVKISGGSESDRISLAEALLRLRNAAEAREVFDEIGGNPEDLVKYLELQAKLEGAEGNIPAAIATAKRLLERKPVQIKHDLLFVQLTQLSSEEGVRRDGIEHLLEMARGEDERALTGLRNLARFEEITEERRGYVIQRLLAIADKREDRMLALELSLKQSDANTVAVVRQARTFYNLDEIPEQTELGRWFNQHGLYEATLELVSESESLRRQDLFLIRADALAMSNQWPVLQRLLSRHDVPLQNYIGGIFRMRANMESGDYSRARIEWERALLDAGRDVSKLKFLKRYVETLNLTSYREDVLKVLAQIPLESRTAYIEWLRLLEEGGRTREMWQRLKELQALFPEDLAVVNDRHYFGLLIGEPPGPSLQEAQLQIERNPNHLAPYMTRALAFLKTGNAADALEGIRRLPVEWDELSSRWKLLIACILGANGEYRWAERYLDAVDRKNMLPEEANMVQQYITP